MTPTELADHERVTAQWVGIVLTSLARSGLITRSPDRGRSAEGHRRGHRRFPAALSSRDQAIVERLTEVMGQEFDAAEHDALVKATLLLERLADKL